MKDESGKYGVDCSPAKSVVMVWKLVFAELSLDHMELPERELALVEVVFPEPATSSNVVPLLRVDGEGGIVVGSSPVLLSTLVKTGCLILRGDISGVYGDGVGRRGAGSTLCLESHVVSWSLCSRSSVLR